MKHALIRIKKKSYFYLIFISKPLQIFSHRGNNHGITVLFWLHIRKCDNINKKTGKSKDEMKQEPINPIIGG